jgi:hypothetical protein
MTTGASLERCLTGHDAIGHVGLKRVISKLFIAINMGLVHDSAI